MPEPLFKTLVDFLQIIVWLGVAIAVLGAIVLVYRIIRYRGIWK